MKNIAVFVSGSGSDFQSVADGINNGTIKNGKIKLLISSKAGVYALERAEKMNIPSYVFAKKDYETIDVMYDEIIKLLKENDIDLIVLAGFLGILNEKIVKTYENKIINIHPSLIPSFCGMGYYGLKVHSAVIEYGVKLTGATVHFVNENADEGAIILQRAVEVAYDDTPESLQQKVLEVEHKLLPEAVKLFCDDKIVVDKRKVKILN